MLRTPFSFRQLSITSIHSDLLSYITEHWTRLFAWTLTDLGLLVRRNGHSRLLQHLVDMGYLLGLNSLLKLIPRFSFGCSLLLFRPTLSRLGKLFFLESLILRRPIVSLWYLFLGKTLLNFAYFLLYEVVGKRRIVLTNCPWWSLRVWAKLIRIHRLIEVFGGP